MIGTFCTHERIQRNAVVSVRKNSQDFSFVVELVDDGCVGYFIFMTYESYFLAYSNHGQIFNSRYIDGTQYNLKVKFICFNFGRISWLDVQLGRNLKIDTTWVDFTEKQSMNNQEHHNKTYHPQEHEATSVVRFGLFAWFTALSPRT